MGSWTEREPRLRWLLFGVCVILVLQVIWFLLLLPFGWQHKGQIGDLFGGLNTFFTGLAFVGLVFTILLQRYDLREQGKELQNQGKELRRSNKLSVRATLANIYTQQMVVMEQGGLRKELWAAEIQLHRIAKGDSNEPSTEEDRDEAMETDDYHTYMTNRDNPVFRPSFELWHQRRSELAELSEELSEELKELEGQPKRHTSHSRKL